ncbi:MULTISPECIES: UDP-N-acetylmuramoyl-L-alanine--D-glutamate ligase [unclassified Methylophaga]|uniref:UDP-N-acetylmuramoyl-L-alanine--D-glutamate ligase n=1 Tax=unclassified Methylophaga TaxID=2629249 RepID=UPI000C90B0CB|nr:MULTISPECIES: UDP-N-acetylmuramoyl-L-alanine--D-glutamate ligase [unclassified Methylophaga]MBN47192.1 UDP-N-acetylmuramoyl-L-alanine--D-glutamate ligase [Methylophaga sp.]|tara:strand:- start:18433 stop:19788 length:1356 start_codon:yes stop_codon:yes gene_type:complete
MTAELQQHSSHYSLIIGLGQTGLSCARFLLQQGNAVAVIDSSEKPSCLNALQKDFPEVVVKTGGIPADWLMRADSIVLSPGVDPRLPQIRQAYEAGIEIVGDIELFARHANAPIIAITGSNGKSTVTTLVGLMAKMAGKNVAIGGNLGIPALDLLTDPAPDFYVLELSSFQMETVKSLNAFASVILNVSADHLDRYDSIEDYQRAKQKVYQGNGVMVINRDDPIVSSMAIPGRNQLGFSLHESQGYEFGVLTQRGHLWLAEGDAPLMLVSEMKIAGRHNIANALAALALGSVMGLPMDAMLKALREFKGLPHRCRFVRELHGVRWFNDSKATNVGASIAAIEGLADNGKIVLIAGGVGKGQNFAPLASTLNEYVSTIILIGQSAEEIARNVPKSVQVHFAADMKAAVQLANSSAESGQQVLLSPACASFDQFANYVDRGERFEQAVRELAA